MNQLLETGFLRLPQIIGDAKRGITPLIPVCKSSWWAGIKTGRYPKPIKLGPRTTVWAASSIRNLIENPSTSYPARASRVKPTAIELAGQA